MEPDKCCDHSHAPNSEDGSYINEKGMKINRILPGTFDSEAEELNFFNQRIGRIENLEVCTNLQVC
jgi:hypothetical protein